MKKIGLTWAVLVLAAGIGCNKSTPGGGGTHAGSGSTATTESKSGLSNPLGPKEGQFNLKAPDAVVGVAIKATTIKQGESLKKDIGISRGKNFDQDVQIAFEGLPQGVSIDPATPTLKHGEDKVSVTLKADEKAALAEATVKIIGKPAKDGGEATTNWTVKVEKK